MEQTDPVDETRRTSTFTSRALVLLLVLAVLGVSYASSIRAWLNQRSEQHALSAQIAAQQTAIESMKRDSARLNDPAYIEMLARLRFGWVMPGEHSYRVLGPNGKVLSVGSDALTGPLSGSGTAEAPWWSGAAGSLARADARPQAKKSEGPQRQPAKRIGAVPDKPTGR